MLASRAEARFVGVPPHVFTSGPSRAVDNGLHPDRKGGICRADARRTARFGGSHTAERQKVASAPL